jgi:hypothetical protein
MASYSSSEAAQMLGIAPLTLRKLSAAFAAWLSSAATQTAQVGESSERSYTDDDLDMLRHAATLLRQKRDYAWAREQLAVEFGVRDADPEQVFVKPEPEAQPAHTAPDEDSDAATAEVVEPEFQRSDTTPHEASHVVEAEVIEPELRVPPDIAVILERIAGLYQDLLRDKEQEIAALRQALDMAELAAASEQRELETVNRLAKIMERENQRLAAELEEARRQPGRTPGARRGLLARVFGGNREDAQSAPQT